MINITTVIATSGDWEKLKITLSSIRNSRKPEGYLGVVVVENGPQKRVESLARGFSMDVPVRYFYIEKSNKSLALNHAISKIENGYAYFNDDDIDLNQEAIVAMSEAAGSITTRAFFGGAVSFRYVQAPEEWLKKYFTFFDGWRLEFSRVAEVTHPCFFGANWMASVDDLRSVGGFSEKLGPTKKIIGEDTEIQKRLLGSGVKGYYVPEAKIVHYEKVDFFSAGNMFRNTFGKNAAKQMLQNYPITKKLGIMLYFSSAIIKHSVCLLVAIVKKDRYSIFDRQYRIVSYLGCIYGLFVRAR